jgi:hypothetical protein
MRVTAISTRPAPQLSTIRMLDEPIGSVADIGEPMPSVVPISANAPRRSDESTADGSAQSERAVAIV